MSEFLTWDEMEEAGWACHQMVCDQNCCWPACMGPHPDEPSAMAMSMFASKADYLAAISETTKEGKNV